MSAPEEDANARGTVEFPDTDRMVVTVYDGMIAVDAPTADRYRALSAWLHQEGFVNMAIHVAAAANIVDPPEPEEAP